MSVVGHILAVALALTSIAAEAQDFTYELVCKTVSDRGTPNASHEFTLEIDPYWQRWRGKGEAGDRYKPLHMESPGRLVLNASDPKIIVDLQTGRYENSSYDLYHGGGWFEEGLCKKVPAERPSILP